MRNLVVCFFSLTLTNALYATKPDEKERMQAWADAFLLNQSFYAEYAAFMDSPRMPDETSEQRFASDTGRRYWKRALFASAFSRFLNQPIIASGGTDIILEAQSTFFMKSEDKKKVRDLIAQLKLPSRDAFIQVQKSFAEAKHATAWQDFASVYATASGNCDAITLNDLKDYQEHQQNLLKASQATIPRDVLFPVADLDVSEMECLALRLMTDLTDGNVNRYGDPLRLFFSLSQLSQPAAKSRLVRTLFAVRLLQKQMHAEALRILISLNDTYSSYRLAYETVQRIFAIRQKGDGKVAIRGY